MDDVTYPAIVAVRFRKGDYYYPYILGSGVLVAPNTVITARHVLNKPITDTENDISWLHINEWFEATPNTYFVIQTQDGRCLRVARLNVLPPEVSKVDLALMETKEDIDIEPLPLIEVREDDIDELSHCSFKVVGFPSDKTQPIGNKLNTDLSVYNIDPNECTDRQSTDGIWEKIQLNKCGVDKGMSGSPLLVEYRENVYIMGLVYVGGRHILGVQMLCDRHDSENLPRYSAGASSSASPHHPNTKSPTS